MRLPLISLLLSLGFLKGVTQVPDHAAAKKLMADGYLHSANRMLRHLHRIEPANIQFAKDLAISYQYLKKPKQSWKVLRKTIHDSIADDQCYQLATTALKTLNEKEQVVDLLRNGLRIFPKSGPLYLEMGNIYASQRNDSALVFWENGIRVDPTYARNYYYAAKYRMAAQSWLTAFLLGEHFVNLETSGTLHIEIKELLAAAHRNWISCLTTDSCGINQQSPVLLHVEKLARDQREQNITLTSLDDLVAFHIRLVFDWFENNPDADKLMLFDYHRRLLREGHFESYVRWLLGSMTNQPAFQRWYKLNETSYHAFKRYLAKQPFRPGQTLWLNNLNKP
jgi:tetratricopeptide (TPR) repeat protein